jgi:hypothetical protein
VSEHVRAWQDEFPGVQAKSSDGHGQELITIPPALDAGHESHFPLVLDEFLRYVDEQQWPAATVSRTLAKYSLLAEAAAVVARQAAEGSTARA